MTPARDALAVPPDFRIGTVQDQFAAFRRQPLGSAVGRRGLVRSRLAGALS